MPTTQPWTQAFQQFAQGLQAIATIVAIGAGALWTYWLFIRTRQHKPRAELSHSVTFRRIGDTNKSFISVTLKIKNLGDIAVQLATAESVVQAIDPFPADLPTRLCVPNISTPDALPTSGELAWPAIGQCLVSLKDCHVEPKEQHCVQFDHVVEGRPRCIHLYSHVENIKIRGKGKEVPIGWACRSTHVFKEDDLKS